VRLVPRPGDVRSPEGEQSSLNVGLRDASESLIERIRERVESPRGERVEKSIPVRKVVVRGARRYANRGRHLAKGQFGGAVLEEQGIGRIEESVWKISVVIALGAHAARALHGRPENGNRRS
jgi:hypothetical protein